jgi:hypothetical protein
MIIDITATVSDAGKLDFNCTVDHRYSYEQIRDALVVLRDELNRQIAEGPRSCPFKDHQGDSEHPRLEVQHRACPEHAVSLLAALADSRLRDPNG